MALTSSATLPADHPESSPSSLQFDQRSQRLDDAGNDMDEESLCDEDVQAKQGVLHSANEGSTQHDVSWPRKLYK